MILRRHVPTRETPFPKGSFCCEIISARCEGYYLIICAAYRSSCCRSLIIARDPDGRKDTETMTDYPTDVCMCISLLPISLSLSLSVRLLYNTLEHGNAVINNITLLTKKNQARLSCNYYVDVQTIYIFIFLYIYLFVTQPTIRISYTPLSLPPPV